MRLVFATHNQNKFNEVKKLLPAPIQLVSLTDIGCIEEIPETGQTLEENAILKAEHVTQNYGLPCIADDTGLLVDALDGAPGVYSARYAGERKNAMDNMQKLLSDLQSKTDRTAHFETVIALKQGLETQIFTGSISGEITRAPKGAKGFGYDPIFKPEGYEETFAELSIDIKNQIGHRGKAIQKLLVYLQKLNLDK